jgi:hypothetical protein
MERDVQQLSATMDGGELHEGTGGSSPGGLEIAFRLPIEGWPRAVFQSDYGYRGGRLLAFGTQILHAPSREALERGVGASANGASLAVQLVERAGAPVLRLTVDGKEALREGRIWAKPTRSAWTHAFIALGGSAAGFAASSFYLIKAAELHDDWARKMGIHTAGWHLLLTLTLFPASVWGQRPGIRAVQLVSLVFACIHAGIALANSDANSNQADPAIAFFNAASGVLFVASLLYGNRAHRDMDPVAALCAGRV